MNRRQVNPRTRRWFALALTAAGALAASAEEHSPDGAEAVTFTAAQRQALDIAVAAAGPAPVAVRLRLTGQVGLNLDRTAHVTARVPGVVTEVRRSFGDRVEAGQVLAVLESRQLAEARADFLTARARAQLAETSFPRQEALWREQIASERQYLDARQALAEARIALRAAEQKLHALGVGQAELHQLPDDPEEIGRYLLVAPIAGTVVDRHATPGQVLSDTDPAFVLADLRSVWVELSVQLDDLARVRAGQTVQVLAGDGSPQVVGRIDFVAPVVDEATRTARARVVLADGDGTWRPGTPVHAFVSVDAREVAVAVPRAAIYDVEGQACVFVDGDDGFRRREVALGLADDERVEVTAGLAPGEGVVARGGVHVKSALLRSQIGGHED